MPRRTALISLAACAGALVAAAPAAAAPAVTGEFALTGVPQYLASGPDGNIWTTLSGSGSGQDVARITPAGVVTEYDAPALDNLKGITAGPDGNLWATGATKVVRFSPANPAGATATTVADITDPRAITVGADGKLWTGSGDKVVSFTPANPAGFTSVTVAGMGARGIAAGGDGALWIADFGSQRIVRVTTAGVVTPIPVGGGPQEVAAGPGSQIGFANPGANPQVFGRIDGGAVSGSSPMPATDPFGITLGNDQAYWVARFAANDIARVTTDGQVTTLGGLSAAAGPRYIAKGPGDTLWVGLETAKKVARISGVEAPPATTPTTPTPTPTTPTATPAPAPAITRLSTLLSRLRVGAKLPALVTTGGQFRIVVSRPVTVRFTVAKVKPGRLVDGTCRRPPRANRRGRACVLVTRPAGSFSLRIDDPTKDHRVRFQGRLSATRSVSPGRYRLTADDGQTSAPARTVFTLKAS